MKIGIVGLPQCGKTSIFGALTGANIDMTAYGGKKESNLAVVKVPDERLEALDAIFEPKKKTAATIEYIDLSGIGAGGQKKGGFSDQFLGQIRIVDAILVILRNFKDDNIPHPHDTIDPERDMENVQAEFVLSDLGIMENRIAKLEKQMRGKKEDKDVREHELLNRLKIELEQEIPLRRMQISTEEEKIIRGYQFLTLKPLIIVQNISEDQISDSQAIVARLDKWKDDKTRILAISAQIEMEIQQLDDEEAEIFRADLGITEPAMDVLIRASYDLLGYIAFFTVGEDEVRAWTITRNTPAPLAAGEIHSDIERGFIRAEVVNYADFITRKTLAKCKTDGVLRLEGKEYIVRDGDIINFRFAI